MHRDISPEERLLALIKGKHKKVDPPTVAPSDVDEPKAQLGESKRKKWLASKHNLFQPAALKSLNKSLIIILVVSLVYFIVDSLFIKPYKDISELVSNAPDAKRDIAEVKKEMAPEAKDFSYYSNAISGKKIFGQSPGEQEAMPKEIGASEDIARNLGLVGIVAGEKPQAIIEDKKNQKTYYLHKGDSFNDFTVEDISEAKVILGHGDKRIALFL